MARGHDRDACEPALVSGRDRDDAVDDVLSCDTFHACRHTFASRVYAQNRDAITVADLLGHASLDTTKRYAQAPSDAARRAVLALD